MHGSRIFGLDLLRAVAIMVVVFWHSQEAISQLVPDFRSPVFLDGVDLFFVLSGYLIGGILLKALAAPGRSWRQRLLGFWRRRFARTLPNYYLFLAINILLVAVGWRNGVLNRNTLAYVVLLQDVWKPVDLFFWESWSLVVEVWFYLLLPFGIFMLVRSVKATPVQAFVITACAMIVLPLTWRLLRAPLWMASPDGLLSVRHVVIERIDTLGIGALAAVVQQRFQWQWYTFRWPLFILGAIGLAIFPSFYGGSAPHYSLTWYYSLDALSTALLLPLLVSWRSAAVSKPVVWLSEASYAVYLIHLPAYVLVELLLDPSDPMRGWPVLIAYWLLVLVLAGLVRRIYEMPMMARLSPRTQ